MEMAEGRLISPWMNPGALRRLLVIPFEGAALCAAPFF